MYLAHDIDGACELGQTCSIDNPSGTVAVYSGHGKSHALIGDHSKVISATNAARHCCLVLIVMLHIVLKTTAFCTSSTRAVAASCAVEVCARQAEVQRGATGEGGAGGRRGSSFVAWLGEIEKCRHTDEIIIPGSNETFGPS